MSGSEAGGSERSIPLGAERECPECGGRQVLQSVGRTPKGEPPSAFVKQGEAWVCTDTHCDRRDLHTDK